VRRRVWREFMDGRVWAARWVIEWVVGALCLGRIRVRVRIRAELLRNTGEIVNNGENI